jgi:hypothetical protein
LIEKRKKPNGRRPLGFFYVLARISHQQSFSQVEAPGMKL